MLKTTALHNMLRQIIESLEQTSFITFMVEETIDISNKEQVVFCLRWFDHEFEVHEEFIALHAIDSTYASHIFAVIKAVLTQLHIPINNIRGNAMTELQLWQAPNLEFAKLVLAELARAIYTHCYGHALNLACGNTINNEYDFHNDSGKTEVTDKRAITGHV